MLLTSLLTLYSSPLHAQQRPECIDPRQLVTTVAHLIHGDSRATAVFIAPTRMATVQHVASDLGLTRDRWTKIRIEQHIYPEHGNTLFRQAMLDVKVAAIRSNGGSEFLYILEMERPFTGMTIALIANIFPQKDDYLMGVGYPGSILRKTTGRYLAPDTENSNDHLVELSDYDDWNVFMQGGSGSPVFDCSGRLVGLISGHLWSSHNNTCSGGNSDCTQKTDEQNTSLHTATDRIIPIVGFYQP